MIQQETILSPSHRRPIRRDADAQALNFFSRSKLEGGRQGHIFFKSEKTHPIYSCVGRHLERYKQARSII